MHRLNRSRSNSWGLHMPLICRDGAVFAYAWKRQLAVASVVDRIRLALKGHTDQRRRFFPHIDDGFKTEGRSKKTVVVSLNPAVLITDDDDDHHL